MADKVAFGIIRASVKFFAASLRFACDDFAVAAFARTFCKRHRTGVFAFGEARTGKKIAEPSQFFNHRLSAQFAHLVGRLVHRSLIAFKGRHNFFDALMKRKVKVAHHLRPLDAVFFDRVQIALDFGRKIFVYNFGERFDQNVVYNAPQSRRNELTVVARNVIAVEQNRNNRRIG